MTLKERKLSNKKLKILIGFDKLITYELVKNVFNETLKQLTRDIEFRSFEVVPEDTPESLPDAVVGSTRLTFGDPQDLIDRISEIDILVVTYAPVTARVIESARHLKAIGIIRTGPDNVDVEAATGKGIPILYAAGRNSVSVAEITMGLILSEMRNITRADAWMRTGAWEEKSSHQEIQKMFEGPELYGKTLGIVGFGRIGRLVPPRAKGFGMKVIAYDPYVDKETMEKHGVKRVDLQTLLKQSDVVTLHIRLKPGAKHVIGKKELDLMKESAYLINTSDGPVVDQGALREALQNGRIAGVGQEGLESTRVRGLEGTPSSTLTPGLGGATKEIPERGVRIVARDIVRFFKGEEPKNILNPEVL